MTAAAININNPAAAMRARVRASRSSFTAGMMALPRARRDAMYALYGFCREVDDIADDGPNEQARRAGLALWRTRIARLFRENTAEDAITQALQPAVAAYGLAEEDFQAIIDGMEMDAGAPICKPSMAKLDTYCDRVASAVGRASVRIFGDSSAQAMRVAHHLGRALQLTNILRDLNEDARRGRLYLPHELLYKHGMADATPRMVLAHVDLPRVCRDLAEVALGHFREARDAMRQCDRRAMRPARIMGAYYRAILDRLIEQDWQETRKRVELPLWRKIWLALSSL
ncbi:MAG: presqualene diphosphate synthase HpnD [Alphaproteobacteria bacterium]|nr:presqualene diphosphate synthase HpnD [Alphaproteobacteria bacterium]